MWRKSSDVAVVLLGHVFAQLPIFLHEVYTLNNEMKFNNNNIYLLQLCCHPVAVVNLHVNKTWNWLLLNLSREGYMRSM